MSYQVLDKDSDNPTYVFSSFWDFVLLCIHLKPGYTLRAYLYAVVGWMIGAAMGLSIIQEVTWKWAVTQIALLVFILAACTLVTYTSLSKEWDYLRSTNLVRKVPKEKP
jgi:uncharacterized membrane protein AbrB (regulator of aidB expression)